MPRLSSGFYVKEINLSEPRALYSFLEKLINFNIGRVGITLEPGVVDVNIGDERLAIAVGSLTFILEPNIIFETEQLIRVARDTWIEYVWVDPKLIAFAVKSILECRSTKSYSTEIVVYGNCPACSAIVVETLALKCPQRLQVTAINVDKIKQVATSALKENMMILVACSDDVVTPLIWLDRKNHIRKVYTCCPSTSEEFAFVIQSLLDVIISSNIAAET